MNMREKIEKRLAEARAMPDQILADANKQLFAVQALIGELEQLLKEEQDEGVVGAEPAGQSGVVDVAADAGNDV